MPLSAPSSSHLTARQQQVVDFLRAYQAREGMPPTQAEIASRFGFTQKAAGDHLKLIAAKGVIEVRRDIPRGIRFPERAPPPVPGIHLLPLLSRLEMGLPLLAAAQVGEWVPIAPELFRPRADYLRRAGTVLPVDLGIRPGDLVGVHFAEAGEAQLVVAKRMTAGGAELLIGRYLRRADGAMLQVHDGSQGFIVIEPAPARGGAVEIEGLYCGHFHPHAA
jgi:repressor LexA